MAEPQFQPPTEQEKKQGLTGQIWGFQSMSERVLQMTETEHAEATVATLRKTIRDLEATNKALSEHCDRQSVTIQELRGRVEELEAERVGVVAIAGPFSTAGAVEPPLPGKEPS